MVVRVGEATAVKLELCEAKEPEGDTVVVTVGVVLALAQPLTVAEVVWQLEAEREEVPLVLKHNEKLAVLEGASDVVRVGVAAPEKLKLPETVATEGEAVPEMVGVVLALAQPLTVAEVVWQFEDVKEVVTLAVALDEKLPVAED